MRMMKVFCFMVALMVLSPYAFAGHCDCSQLKNWRDSDCMCYLNQGDPSRNPNCPHRGGQGQAQGQGQGQGQGQNQGQVANGGNGFAQGGDGGSVAGSGNSANRNSNLNHANATNEGNNSTLAFSSSNDGTYDNSTHVTVPAPLPETPPSVVAGASINTLPLPCGPRQTVVSTPVYGFYMGFWKTKQLPLDHNDTLVPADKMFLESQMDNGTKVYIGDYVIINTTALGISGARNIGLGGGSGSGNWGQAGGGASGSMQAMVTHITLVECLMPTQLAQTMIREQPAKINQ